MWNSDLYTDRIQRNYLFIMYFTNFPQRDLRSFIAEPGSSLYTYNLRGDESLQVCATIILDAAQKQVMFNSLTLVPGIASAIMLPEFQANDWLAE